MILEAKVNGVESLKEQFYRLNNILQYLSRRKQEKFVDQ